MRPLHHPRNWQYSALFLFGMLFTGLAFADPTNSLPTVMDQLQTTAKAANADITKIAVKTLGAVLTLQWMITWWREAFTAGDVSSIMAKLVGYVMWGSICYWVMENQYLLIDMFSGYLTMTNTIAGVEFNPAAIWANGVHLQNNLIAGFNKGTDSSSLFGAISNFIPALMLMVACLVILIAYAVIAFSVLISMGEFWLMFAVTPVAVSLMGLNAFRDQGMAPLKGIISLGLRIIILGLIVRILGAVQETATNSFMNLPNNDPMETVWFTLGGIFACAMMAMNAGKIASSIATGSANFSSSDAIKGGMQMASTGAAMTSAFNSGVSAAMNMGGGAMGSMGKGIAEGFGQSIGQAFGGGGGGGGGGGALGVSPPGKDSGTSLGGPMPANPDGKGNAQGASIGGAPGGASGSPGGEKGQSQNPESKSNNANPFGKAAEAVGQAGEAFSQDEHSVGIQMNTRGD